MRTLILFVTLFGFSGPAYAQIVIERNDASTGSEVGLSAPVYKRMDYSVSCKKDLEYTNVHIRGSHKGRGVVVRTGKNCNIVLRDCRVDGDIVASGKGSITLERCVVNGSSYSLWADGSGDITLIDSVVHSKKTSVLIHRHATGNVNLIRTKLEGGKTDVRGKGRIIRGESVSAGVVILKPTGETFPREGFVYQPKDLTCSGTATKTVANKHFDKGAVIIGGDQCDLVVNGCILESDLVAVVVRNGNITLRDCEVRSKKTAIRVMGSGSITLVDSTLSSPGNAVRTHLGSRGNVTLTRTKILRGKVIIEGKGKVVR